MEKWEKKIVCCGLWLSAWAVMIGCVIYFFMYMWVLATLDIPGTGFLNVIGLTGIAYGILKICIAIKRMGSDTSATTSATTSAKKRTRKSPRKSTKTAPKK